MNSRRWYTRQWRCSKGSKDIRTKHRTESNLEPFDTGSVRTGTLVEVDVVCLCGCKCLQACTTTLNQFSVMGGGGEGGGCAVDNGWKGVHPTACIAQIIGIGITKE